MKTKMKKYRQMMSIIFTKMDRYSNLSRKVYKGISNTDYR